MAIPTKYQGYNEKVDATKRTDLSTAAYRFGHSQVENSWSFLKDDYQEKVRADISLQENFFNTAPILYDLSGASSDKPTGIEPILYGMVSNSSEAVDKTFVSDLSENLLNSSKLQTF